MLVYRVCDKKELIEIFKNESLDNVAKKYNIDFRINNHHYKPDKKYIHFFQKYEDVFYFDSVDRTYICTYDIPKTILDNSKGIGYYLDRVFFKTMEAVTEYAVDGKFVKFNNLIKVDKMIDMIIFEEYLDNSYQDKIITIYEKEDSINKSSDKVKKLSLKK